LIKVIMMILNIRLGQWIPHPANFRKQKQKVKEDKTPSSTRENWLKNLAHSVKACVHHLIDGPNILGLICFSGIRKIENRSFCFVTDGGHYENLGLWPLLDRRCFLILVSDASQDGHHSFEDFLRLCRRSRLEFDIDLVELEKKNDEDVPFQIHALR